MTLGRRIRTLVVDDSVIARRFITKRLEKDPEIEVVGTAASGATALDLVRRERPDVVILDEEMPDMRGRDVLKLLRAEHPTVAVVMFSGHVGKGTQARFEAMLLGADDAVAKPTASGGPIDDDHPTWSELLTKTKSAARSSTRGGAHLDVARTPPPVDVTPTVEPAAAPAPVARARHTRTSPTKRRARPVATTDPGVCVIASSTGGPDALSEVFSALPADFPLPILVVQHMPPHFTSLLAKRLDGRSALRVMEATGDEPLEPGVAYLAPGDRHLAIAGHTVGCRTRLSNEQPENSCRPSADVLFRSAAVTFRGRVVVCVISGMGQDGMLGAVDLHAAGATVIAQDEDSSVVWGMPGAVVAAGVASKVLPLAEIADALTLSARAVVARAAKAAGASGGRHTTRKVRS